ncbi:hypothetical protein C8Q74DRAFT_189609 [Fomes fomentarius]|nr:hypothetical protein C8Q74DRAFT_189609 [Fomes fomentarius]
MAFQLLGSSRCRYLALPVPLLHSCTRVASTTYSRRCLHYQLHTAVSYDTFRAPSDRGLELRYGVGFGFCPRSVHRVGPQPLKTRVCEGECWPGISLRLALPWCGDNESRHSFRFLASDNHRV